MYYYKRFYAFLFILQPTRYVPSVMTRRRKGVLWNEGRPPRGVQGKNSIVGESGFFEGQVIEIEDDYDANAVSIQPVSNFKGCISYIKW